VPEQGPRRTIQLLRLPGQALEAYPLHQPDRIDIREDPLARTKRTKGCGSVSAELAMVFKLAQCAKKKWNKLYGGKLLADVIDTRFVFIDGIKRDTLAA